MNTWTFLPFSFSFNEFCFQVISNTRENKNSNEIMSLSRMIRVKVHSNTCRIVILTSIIWLLIYVVVLMNYVELLSTNTNRKSKYEDVVSSIQFSQLVCYQKSRLSWELRSYQYNFNMGPDLWCGTVFDRRLIPPGKILSTWTGFPRMSNIFIVNFINCQLKLSDSPIARFKTNCSYRRSSNR